MAFRFRVHWTAHAVADLTEIIRFIALDSPQNAIKFYQRIRKRAGTLRSFPDRGHVVRELAELDVRIYRELLISPYRLLYRIDGKTVFVMAVLDGRRDLRQILSERLLRVAD